MSRAHAFDGIIVIDKPSGPTSARVVAQVKRLLGAKRVGHTGTLDPMATGVLPLCVGRATKIAGYLLAGDKGYAGEITFGVETDTLDRQGEVVAQAIPLAKNISFDDVVAAAASFCGEIKQVPPMFSALRKNGVRLYKLARAGKNLELEPRSVRIDRFSIEEFIASTHLAQGPRVRFTIQCSKGTYIRSIARDLGQLLGCGAHLSELRRIRAGQFGLDVAIPLDQLSPMLADKRHVSLREALAHMDSIVVEDDVVGRIGNGLNLRWDQLGQTRPIPDKQFCIVTTDSWLLAIASVKDGLLSYERVFSRS